MPLPAGRCDAGQMTRRVSKFGGGVSTPPLLARAALTAATLGLGAMLAIRIIREAGYAHLQVAALVLFMLGVWLLGALIFLPHVWRPSGEWKRDQFEAHRLERRLRLALEPSRQPDRALLRAQAAYCGVCGQHGLTVARSRMVCTACQRPWAAGTAAMIDLRDQVSARR